MRGLLTLTRAAEASHSHAGPALELVMLGAAGLAVIVYAAAVVGSRRRGRPWPAHRLVLWCAGIVAATIAVIGPVADASHRDFVAHMWAHLLVGMLAPVLLVLAAPVTLALRTLAVTPARRLTSVLRSAPVRVVSHPIPALLLSAGGLWLIYRSPIFEAMPGNPLLHLLVHAHLLIAGYLFTAAIIGLDPAPHAPRRALQAIVLLVAVASHAVLAKSLYASPPESVPMAQAQAGAQFMYSAGGWVEAVIIVVFCAQWYRAAGRVVGRGPVGGVRPAGNARARS